MYRNRHTKYAIRKRQGASAVEAVLVAPMLVVILLGAIDIGQYVHVAQTVSNTSREVARFASRHNTSTVAEVTDYAHDYLGNAFPRLSEQEIEDAVDVTVTNVETGNHVPHVLSTIGSANAMSVTVEFDFQAVRWLKNIDYWDLEQSGVTTTIRRE